jgi:hypothetical protein
MAVEEKEDEAVLCRLVEALVLPARRPGNKAAALVLPARRPHQPILIGPRRRRSRWFEFRERTG